MIVSAIHRRSAIDEGLHGLESLIDSLPPESPIPSQRELSKRFGIGRSSVREALQVLQSRGRIQVIPSRGTITRAQEMSAGTFTRGSAIGTSHTAAELMELRVALESAAADLAAARASSADVHELEVQLDAMRAAAMESNLGALVRADLRFHAAVVRASGNRVFEGLLREVESLLTETRRSSLSRVGRPGKALVRHTAVADAIKRRDPAGARTAMLDHFTESGSDMGVTPDRWLLRDERTSVA